MAGLSAFPDGERGIGWDKTSPVCILDPSRP